jgi:hypothetical protein
MEAVVVGDRGMMPFNVIVNTCENNGRPSKARVRHDPIAYNPMPKVDLMVVVDEI